MLDNKNVFCVLKDFPKGYIFFGGHKSHVTIRIKLIISIIFNFPLRIRY